MPLYEYVCEECEHPFEALVFGADPAPECPQCHSRKLARQLSLPLLIALTAMAMSPWPEIMKIGAG